MTNEEIIQLILDKNERCTIDSCIKFYGVTESRARIIAKTVRDSRKHNGLILPSKTMTATTTKKTIGISIEELRSKHDIFYIVQKTVESLEKDVFYQNSDFIVKCNFPSNSGYRETLERKEFESYRGKAGSSIYWGHPESIGKLKEEGVLR